MSTATPFSGGWLCKFSRNLWDFCYSSAKNFLPLLWCYCIAAAKKQRKIYSSTAPQRKSHLCIPFLGIARPHSQFPRSCVCERFIFSQDRSTYFLQQNRQIVRKNTINCSQTHECGNWDCGHAIPFLGSFFSNCRYVCILIFLRSFYQRIRLQLDWTFSSTSDFKSSTLQRDFLAEWWVLS